MQFEKKYEQQNILDFEHTFDDVSLMLPYGSDDDVAVGTLGAGGPLTGGPLGGPCSQF